MTKAQYAAILAAPLNPAVWPRSEMTKAQYDGIIAAIAAAGSAPALGAAPVQNSGSAIIKRYGGDVVACGDPDAWMTVTIQSVVYSVPCFLP